MKFYFAPMEGITVHVYRNMYRKYFDEIDRYFTPFISGNRKASMKSRELRDVLAENNPDINIIPQILTNDVEEFVNTARRIQSLGYDEVNLNLGCPSGTVSSKGRGSGFLAETERLDEFLDGIYSKLSDMKISIKTRLGKNDVEEFDEILNIYSKYPLSELIIHPRIQKEFYSGNVHLDQFEKALDKFDYPVCYNGDIFTVQDYINITQKYPQIDRVMIGRGLLTNPFLIKQINGSDEKLTGQFVREFYRGLYEGYCKLIPSEKDRMFKMKELWAYQVKAFVDEGKYGKEVFKAKSRDEFLCAMDRMVNNCEIKEDLRYY